MVGAGFIAAAFRNSFGAFHHQGAADTILSLIITVLAGWFGFDGVFTFWIAGTAVERPETAAPFNHFSFFTDRAFDAGRVDVIGTIFNKFTFGIIVAGNKKPEATFFFH